jgi:hypothetical protein
MVDKVGMGDSLRDKVVANMRKERQRVPRPSHAILKSLIRHPIFCC